jgi:hypothetical protein
MKTINWTPDATKYLALRYSLVNGIVTVYLVDGSIRKVNLNECSIDLQNQFKKVN